MSYRVHADTFRPAYIKSIHALDWIKGQGGHTHFTTYFEETYNVKWDAPYLVFENEAWYTWFIVRWS